MSDPTYILFQCVIIAGLAAIFYAVLIRPQQQRLRRHRDMLASLRPGDQIATVGGLVGTIVRTDGDEFLTVEVASRVEVTITRKSVDKNFSEANYAVAWVSGVHQATVD